MRTHTPRVGPDATETAGVMPGPVASRDAPGAPRRRLLGHESRSGTTAHGGGAMVIGGVFLAVGTFIALAALNVIPADDSSFHAPRELVAGVGAVFFALPGASLLVHGAIGSARARRRKRELVLEFDRPWKGDHPWNARGEWQRGLRPVVRRVTSVIALALFLSPFHWLALREGNSWMLWGFVGLFDLIAFAVACDAVLKLLRAVRYGRMHIIYGHFPFHPGEDVTLHFGLARPRDFSALTFTLRCIEEAYETHGSGRNRSQSVVSYALHEDVRELSAEDARPTPQHDVAVTFDVPRDAPGTDLSSRPSRYWELHVHGDAPGPDLDATFLVPIYDRPWRRGAAVDRPHATSSPRMSGVRREPVGSTPELRRETRRRPSARGNSGDGT